MATGSVEYGYGGYRVVWYRDDDNDSGYGDNPQQAYWYGDRAECEQAAKGEPPADLEWHSPGPWKPDMSPGSAAWCESYGDNH